MAQNTIRVSLLADAARFKAGMADAERATGKFEKQTETAGQKVSNFGKVALAGLVAGAGAAFIGFLGDATKAALEDQEAQDQLALALKNTTGATDAQVASVEEWISATALASGVADDELRPALEELVRRTDDVALSQELLATAMDISRAKGKPLQAVVEAIGKAADGNVGALGRLGVATKDAEGKTLTFEQAIAEADRTMGGAAQTFADSESGALARAQVRFDELKEEIGAGLIPILTDAAEAAIFLMEALDSDVPQHVIDSMSDYDKQLLHIQEDGEEVDGVVDDLIASFKALGSELGIGKRTVDDATVSYRRGKDVLDEYNRKAREGEAALNAAASAQRNFTDATLEAADPALALIKSSQRLTAAQEKYIQVVDEFGPTSAEAKDAALDLASAQGELQAASGRFAEEGGQQSIDALLTMMRRAGATEASIDAVRRALERLNSTPINRTGEMVTGRPGDNRSEFHSGGVVAPGLPVGTPVAATLLAGESVAPIGHSSHNGHGGGGGTVINVTVNALDPQGAAKAVVQALQTYNRQNGGIPIVVRQP